MLRKVGSVCIVIMLMVVSNTFPVVHATSIEGCATCAKAPKGLRTYEKTMDKLLKLLPTKRIEAQFVEEGTDRTRQAFAEIERKAILTETSLQAILGPYVTSEYDVFADMKFVYKDTSLQRDWKMLVGMDSKIIERVMEMVQASRHNDPLHTDEAQKVLEEMDLLLKDLGYLRLSKHTNGKYKLGDSASLTYTSLAQMLWHIHILYKELHKKEWYRPTLQRVGLEYEKTNHKRIKKAIQESESESLTLFAKQSRDLLKSVLASDDIYTKFNTRLYLDFADYNRYYAYIRQIQDEYECSNGLARNVCNTKWQEVRKNMAFTYKERVVNDTKHARNSFLTSRSRLKGVFGRGTLEDEQAADQRAESLLHSYRGEDMGGKDGFWDIVDIKTEVDPFPTSVTSAWKGVSNGWKAMSDKLASKQNKEEKSNTAAETSKTQVDDIPVDQGKYADAATKEQILKEFNIAEKELERDKEKIQYLQNYQKDELTRQRVRRMQNAFSSILTLQDEMGLENVFNDVNRTTQKFPALSKAVYENIKIFGDKNDESGMYYAMQQVCDMQCKNLDSKVCEYFSK